MSNDHQIPLSKTQTSFGRQIPKCNTQPSHNNEEENIYLEYQKCLCDQSDLLENTMTTCLSSLHAIF